MDENKTAMTATGFDIAGLDTTDLSNKGIEVRIYNPKTQTDTDIYITVLGQDSEQYREVQRKQNARQLGAAMKQGPRREEKMVEVAEDNIPEILARTTTGWRNLLRDGKPFEFSVANARWLYENMPVIRDQVLEAQRDRANFLAG